VEILEQRLFMDGDVYVGFNDGDLCIRGDGDDNQVVISQPSPGTIRIAGEDETAINGEEFVDFAGSLESLKVNMKQGGEDDVAIQGALHIDGSVVAKMGDGEFVVEGSGGAVEIDGKLEVVGGTADVRLRNEVIVHGRMNIRTAGDATAHAELGGVPDFDSPTFSNPLNITNPYFPLVPGMVLTYEEESIDDETGETIVETVVVEVLNETKTVMGVVNRVLRDRVYVDGLLVEDTSDWHCQDDNGNVWYFGEESTDFEYDENGNLIGTSTATSWEAGVDGALPGIIMLAQPQAGLSYYQEFYPGVALDQGAVLATDESVDTLVGSFEDVVQTKDTSVLSPGGLEHKFYAPGLGLIQEHGIDLITGEIDGVLRLVSAELNGQPVTEVVSPDDFDGTNATIGNGTGPVQVNGEALLRTGGRAILRETRFNDDVEICARSDVAVVDSVVEELSIKSKGDAVGLNNVRVDEEVMIKGDLDVYIFGSLFNDDVEIRLGVGDNTLVIGDSTIGDLDANGGAGDDVFEDEGGNLIEELELRKFEEGAEAD
jgi:hypothetical protein